MIGVRFIFFSLLWDWVCIIFMNSAAFSGQTRRVLIRAPQNRTCERAWEQSSWVTTMRIVIHVIYLGQLILWARTHRSHSAYAKNNQEQNRDNHGALKLYRWWSALPSWRVRTNRRQIDVQTEYYKSNIITSRITNHDDCVWIWSPWKLPQKMGMYQELYECVGTARVCFRVCLSMVELIPSRFVHTRIKSKHIILVDFVCVCVCTEEGWTKHRAGRATTAPKTDFLAGACVCVCVPEWWLRVVCWFLAHINKCDAVFVVVVAEQLIQGLSLDCVRGKITRICGRLMGRPDPC